METRVQLLERVTTIDGGDRRLAVGPGVRELERRRACGGAARPTRSTWRRSPRPSASRASPTRSRTSSGGPGSGSAAPGLRAYNLLVEGRTQALENDVVLSMKQAQTPAVSRVVRDETIRSYFEHEGHRTAVSQGALQAHADPWVGWCRTRRRRPGDQGALALRGRPRLGRRDRDATRCSRSCDDLGRATAKVHCVSDEGSEHPLVDVNVEAKITDVIGDRDDEFARDLAAFGRRVRRADARGPPPLRRRVPQRDDPRRRGRLGDPRGDRALLSRLKRASRIFQR